MNKKLIVGNWKMNPSSLREAEALARGVAKAAAKEKNVEVIICPPFPFLRSMVHGTWCMVGAQDLFWEEKGAYTGEVSAAMLQSLGVEYVIIGHSERRKWLGETDEVINKKVIAAQKAGLKVILCVGEPASVRAKGIVAAKKFMKNQLVKDLRGIRNLQPAIRNLTIAYEPIWAIGSGKADKPEEAAEMARFIGIWCMMVHGAKARVLYGGSVNGGNIASFVQYKEIDGALVGGASLDTIEFKKIIEAAASSPPPIPVEGRLRRGSTPDTK